MELDLEKSAQICRKIINNIKENTDINNYIKSELEDKLHETKEQDCWIGWDILKDDKCYIILGPSAFTKNKAPKSKGLSITIGISDFYDKGPIINILSIFKNKDKDAESEADCTFITAETFDFPEDEKNFEEFEKQVTRQFCYYVKEMYKNEQEIIKIIDEAEKGKIPEILSSHLNVILTGAPGTGKTYSVREYVAEKLLEKDNLTKEQIDSTLEKEKGRYRFVQFHSGYDYTDFVQGYKPDVKAENAQMTFELTDGIFKKFCDVAAKAWENKEAYEKLSDEEKKKIQYYFIIDEINRADLSRVFGELFFGLEDTYRGTYFKTQYGSDMVIPPNLHLIGTMNDVDRGVETIDFALRRRFTWHEVSAKDSHQIIRKQQDFDDKKKKSLIKAMDNINNVIFNELGSEYEIGGAYFVKEDGDKMKIYHNHIKPLLNEYLRGNKRKDEILKACWRAYEEYEDDAD